MGFHILFPLLLLSLTLYPATDVIQNNPPSISRMSRAGELCMILLNSIARNIEAVEPEEPKAVFDAARILIEEGTGVKLPQDGRRVAIPKAWMDPLIEAFKDFYTEPAGPNPKPLKGATPSSIARGNLEHMGDHLNFAAKFKNTFQRKFNIDPKALELAQVAHDIGKAFVNEFIDLYITHRTEGNFLDRYVLAHEFHSIGNIPKVVEKVLSQQGLDITTPKGKKAVVGVSLQIMEMVRLHNAVHVVDNMTERYPDLNATELAEVIYAWWPTQYRNFANKMGITGNYGSEEPLGVISTILNFIDRATLTSPTAPVKLAMQSFGSSGFSKDLIEKAFILPAKGNRRLITAQAFELSRYLSDPQENILELDFVKEAQKYNDQMESLGKRILRMNDPLTYSSIVSPTELPSQTKSSNPLSYLYYRSNDGTLYRVEGSDIQNGTTDKYSEGKWVKVGSSGNAIRKLLELATQDGLWPKVY